MRQPCRQTACDIEGLRAQLARPKARIMVLALDEAAGRVERAASRMVRRPPLQQHLRSQDVTALEVHTLSGAPCTIPSDPTQPHALHDPSSPERAEQSTRFISS